MTELTGDNGGGQENQNQDGLLSGGGGEGGGKAPAHLIAMDSLPEDVRSIPSLAKYAKDGKVDAAALAKAYANAESKLGIDPENLLRLPKDEKGWPDFWNKLGRPERAADYKVGNLPDDVRPFVEGLREVAHANGLTQAQFEKLATHTAKEAQTQRDKYEKDTAKYKQDSLNLLKQEWGGNFDGNLAMANRAMHQLLDPDTIDFIRGTPSLGSNPGMVKMFHKLGGMLAESGLLTGDAPGTGFGGNRAQAMQRMKEIRETQTDALYDQKHKDHGSVVAEYKRLEKVAYPG